MKYILVGISRPRIFLLFLLSTQGNLNLDKSNNMEIMTKERAVGKTIKFAIAPPCYLFWHFYVPKWTQCFVWKIFLWEGVTARQKVLIKSNKNKKFNTPSIEVPCKQQCGAIGPNSTVHITQCFRKEMEDLPRDPEKENMKEICRVATLLRPHEERNSHAIFLSLSLGIWYLTPLAFIVILIDPENTR